jgi:glycosyltransferase involved in cell wall biosynthesis
MDYKTNITTLADKIPRLFTINSVNKIENQPTKFSFVISSYNNEDNIYDNLLSIIYQTYTNWEIFYTNDNSNDKTEEHFFNIVKQFNMSNKVFYTKNTVNKKQAFNKYNIYQKIDKNNVVVILDGDDWLSKNNVLEILNNIYIEEKCYMAYSGYHMYENNVIKRKVNAQSYPMETKINGDYRKYKAWYFSPLRTGYAWLFKMIPKNYLMLDGEWIDRCTDWAEIYCCAELAKEHVYALDDILYIYNVDNSLKYPTSFFTDKNNIRRKNIEKYIKDCDKVQIEIPKMFIMSANNSKERLITSLKSNSINNYEIFESKFPTPNLFSKGLIQSTLQLFQYINCNTDLDHIMVLEDNMYLRRDFSNHYHITNIDLKTCDFMILVATSDIYNKPNQIITNDKNIFDLKEQIIDINIVTYSYICSRQFRNYVLNKGLNCIAHHNCIYDLFVSLYKFDNDNELKMNLYNDYLFCN